jgi:hypothetical protein
MKDNRTEFQRFSDFMKALVKVPKKDALAAQPSATRPAKQQKATKRKA